MDVAIPVLIKPLFLIILLVTAALLARALRPRIPAGAVKDTLYRKLAIVPTSEAQRRDWTAPIALLAASLVVWAWIYVLGRDLI